MKRPLVVVWPVKWDGSLRMAKENAMPTTFDVIPRRFRYTCRHHGEWETYDPEEIAVCPGCGVRR